MSAQPKAKEKWTFKSEHFEFYSNAPRGRTRELVTSFDRLHDLITKGGRTGLEEGPVTVFVFKSQLERLGGRPLVVKAQRLAPKR